jgi:photosystem II stability/assembly factor-like uncharacterized protein
LVTRTLYSNSRISSEPSTKASSRCPPCWFRSETQGDDWEQIDVPVPTLVMSGAILRDGRIVLAGQSGNFLVSSDSGRTFALWKWGATTGVAEILPLADGALLVLGEAGAARIQPRPAQPASSQ